MISRETENVQSSEEIENAFRALSSEFRPYVTAEELYAVRFEDIPHSSEFYLERNFDKEKLGIKNDRMVSTRYSFMSLFSKHLQTLFRFLNNLFSKICFVVA